MFHSSLPLFYNQNEATLNWYKCNPCNVDDQLILETASQKKIPL